jgi:hypothetical protein
MMLQTDDVKVTMKKKTIDRVAFNDYNLERADRGLADIFINLIKNNIMVTDATKGSCYIWNGRTKLWDQRDGIFGQNLLSIRLSEEIERMEAYYMNLVRREAPSVPESEEFEAKLPQQKGAKKKGEEEEEEDERRERGNERRGRLSRPMASGEASCSQDFHLSGRVGDGSPRVLPTPVPR